MINPFMIIIPRKVPPLPGDKFYPTSQDGVTCAGWSWKPEGTPKGTLFYTHGYCYHSRDLAGKELAEQFNLAFVSIDFRNHGWSHNRHPTFGTAEAWDLRGAMDLAEAQGFPRPFIVMGHSLGAMAAQRLAVEDERIAACFLASAPANPWHAIRQAPKYMFPPPLKWLAPVASSLGNLINSEYGWDILTDGDVLRHAGAKNPPHRPLMYFVMGDQDHFGIEETRKVYDHWYQDVADIEGSSEYPHEDQSARKWFVTMPGTKHLGIWLEPKWKPYQESFLQRCLMEVDASTCSTPTRPNLDKAGPMTAAGQDHRSDRLDKTSKWKELELSRIPTLYFEVGGSSIRSFYSDNGNVWEMLRTAPEHGVAPELVAETWDAFQDARHLPSLIGKQAGLHPRPDRVAMSVFGGVSADGRSFEGFWQTQGVPANLAECVENALDLPRGAVRLRNDAESWALGSRAVLQLFSQWPKEPVGVLIMGTGVGFAVVSESGAKGSDLGATAFIKLSQHSQHGQNIHDYLGLPYHQWTAVQGWASRQKSKDAALRIRMVLDVLTEKYKLSNFVLGGGMAEALEDADFADNVVILSRKNLGFDSGLVPMVGLSC